MQIGVANSRHCCLSGFVALWGLLLIGFVALWGLLLIGFVTNYCVCRLEGFVFSKEEFSGKFKFANNFY